MIEAVDSVLPLILRNLPTQDLCRLLPVCKKWNTVLESTQALWREVDAGTNFQSNYKTLRIASLKSGQSLESYKDPNLLIRDEPFEILSLLELSKSTLRRIDLRLNEYELSSNWKQHGSFIEYFRKRFENLEKLKLCDGFLPEGKVKVKGKLNSLAFPQLSIRHQDLFAYHSFSKEDLEWLSNLEILLYVSQDSEQGLPENLYNLLKACGKSLVELQTACFGGTATTGQGRSQLRRKDLELPNLRRLIIKGEVGDGSYDCIQAPNLEALTSKLSTIHRLKFRNLLSLGLIIEFTHGSQEEEENGNRWMLEVIEMNERTLKELLIYPDSENCRSFRLNALSLYLKAGSSQEIKCPNLSSLTIAEDVAQELRKRSSDINEDLSLLAESLVSRRLLSSTSLEVEGLLCCDTMLYIEKDDISRFKVEEERILAGIPERERELAGKAQVKSLEECRVESYLTMEWWNRDPWAVNY